LQFSFSLAYRIHFIAISAFDAIDKILAEVANIVATYVVVFAVLVHNYARYVKFGAVHSHIFYILGSAISILHCAGPQVPWL
jgi:uncharacterized membrane protein